MTEELDLKFEQVAADAVAAGLSYQYLYQTAQCAIVRHALKACKGNKCKTAKYLGVHRNTLSRLVDQFELHAFARSYVTYRKNR